MLQAGIGATTILAAIFLSFANSALAAATLDDADAIPHINASGQQGYREFLASARHRAFAIAPGGTWAWKGTEDAADSAADQALQSCNAAAGQRCMLYAVDDKVVFDSGIWSQLWGPYSTRSEARRAYTGKERGDRFFNLAFKNEAGKPMKLSDLKGKVTLLHFWGSWCPPCLRELPELQQLYRALGASSDIRMILLQMREDFPSGRKWAQQHQLNLPLHDSGFNKSAPDSLDLANGNRIHDRDIAAAFPTTYVLDRHGIVVFSHTGPVSGWMQYLPQLRDVAARSGK